MEPDSHTTTTSSTPLNKSAPHAKVQLGGHHIATPVSPQASSRTTTTTKTQTPTQGAQPPPLTSSSSASAAAAQLARSPMTSSSAKGTPRAKCGGVPVGSPLRKASQGPRVACKTNVSPRPIQKVNGQTYKTSTTAGVTDGPDLNSSFLSPIL